jgi:hypothetical protein
MRLMFIVTCFALAALFGSPAVAAPGRSAVPPQGCPVVKAHPSNTSGDWEAVFGRRKNKSKAVALVNRLHRLGFRCAVIESEQATHEVAVIGLPRRSAAEKIVARAHLAGLAAHVSRS